jgi:hypothetical protein
MKYHKSHKNLNTSYVNLSALLKYLRQQKFVGKVRLETKGYEAEVIFTKKNGLEARDNDHITGKISVGDDVLPRILFRAHDDGIINVIEEPDKKKSGYDPNAPDGKPTDFHQASVRIPIQKPMEQENSEVEEPEPKPVSLKEKLGLPNLPFSFGKAEAKKSEAVNLSETADTAVIEPENLEDPPQDWHELLGLIGELLKSVEESLDNSNLNFVWVFDKVRAEVFEEYPFLHPNSTVFEYKNGEVSMTEQINNNLFVASITESIEKLLEKFQSHPKYDEVRRSVVWSILELMNKNHALYDKYFISQQLEKIIES